LGTLYENIISLCNERGIKGGKLCTDIGMSKGILTDLKMGRQTGISAANAQKIAAYFNVSVGYLLGEEEKDIKKEQPIEIDGLSGKQHAFINKVMQMSDEELDRLDKILSLVENAK
jgi:transcriptional regulator with XRE-family HTH domain